MYGKYFDFLAFGKENIWKHKYIVETCTYYVVCKNILEFGPSNDLNVYKKI